MSKSHDRKATNEESHEKSTSIHSQGNPSPRDGNLNVLA